MLQRNLPLVKQMSSVDSDQKIPVPAQSTDRQKGDELVLKKKKKSYLKTISWNYLQSQGTEWALFSTQSPKHWKISLQTKGKLLFTCSSQLQLFTLSFWTAQTGINSLPFNLKSIFLIAKLIAFAVISTSQEMGLLLQLKKNTVKDPAPNNTFDKKAQTDCIDRKNKKVQGQKTYLQALQEV